MKHCKSLLLCGLLALAGGITQAAPLGTAFNYQGRLEQNGLAAPNGIYQMNFALFVDLAGGIPLSSNNVASVPVTNGLFNTSLDFGPSAFAGEERWLQITVRTNNDALPFVLLSPRTRLAPTPNAVYASTAGTVTNGAIQVSQLGTMGMPTTGQVLGYNEGSLVWQAPGGGGLWSQNGSSAFYNNGRVGIGTNQPSGALHVANGGVAVTGANSPYTGAGKGVFIEKGLNSGLMFAFDYDAFQPLPLLLNSPGGNVGIGTASPQARLHVNGPILSGEGNTLSGNLAAIGGGSGNSAGAYAFVGGGSGNNAEGLNSCVPGGANNYAGGFFSFAAGAKASALHNGSFVWADEQYLSTPPFSLKEFESTAPNQFSVRSSGGVRFEANVVKVGSSAELFAPGAEENLRIIRGTVAANGSRLRGSGFTVTRISIGQYSMSFDVPFPNAATITATFSNGGTTDGRFIRVTENYPSSRLYIFDVLAMNGSPTDDAFNFIAIGPR